MANSKTDSVTADELRKVLDELKGTCIPSSWILTGCSKKQLQSLIDSHVECMEKTEEIGSQVCVNQMDESRPDRFGAYIELGLRSSQKNQEMEVDEPEPDANKSFHSVRSIGSKVKEKTSSFASSLFGKTKKPTPVQEPNPPKATRKT